MVTAFGTHEYHAWMTRGVPMKMTLNRRAWRALAGVLAPMYAPLCAALSGIVPGQAMAAPTVPHTVVNARFACQQTTCDAELWLPVEAAGAPKPPVIVMAHGFGATMDWGLQPFAERFVQAGFAVVRFDYRGFGKSGGEPRQVVDGKAHVQDWLAAIDAIRQRPDVDGAHLGIWGSSYSGGQVLVAAAERPGVVQAVSAQVPFVNGLSSALQYPLKYQPLAAWYALRDLMRGEHDTPLYIPIIAEGGFAALVCDECVTGYRKVVPANAGPNANRVAARVLLTLPFFSPGDRAKDIQAPTLVIAAEHDGLIPIAKVREVAHNLPHGEYVELKGADHFSPYTGPVFEQVVARQTAFFQQHLMGH
jgi:pimeloyl-ACP methyl ester carboxylesterase